MRDISLRFSVAEGIFSRLSSIVRILLANSEAPNLRLPHAPAAGPEAWSNLCRKLGFVVLKEVRQQYPTVFLDNTLYLFLSQFHGWRAFEAVVS